MSLYITSCKGESDNFQIHKLFQTVFINVGFLYLGQNSHVLPAGFFVACYAFIFYDIRVSQADFASRSETMMAGFPWNRHVLYTILWRKEHLLCPCRDFADDWRTRNFPPGFQDSCRLQRAGLQPYMTSERFRCRGKRQKSKLVIKI